MTIRRFLPKDSSWRMERDSSESTAAFDHGPALPLNASKMQAVEFACATILTAAQCCEGPTFLDRQIECEADATGRAGETVERGWCGDGMGSASAAGILQEPSVCGHNKTHGFGLQKQLNAQRPRSLRRLERWCETTTVYPEIRSNILRMWPELWVIIHAVSTTRD